PHNTARSLSGPASKPSARPADTRARPSRRRAPGWLPSALPARYRPCPCCGCSKETAGPRAEPRTARPPSTATAAPAGTLHAERPMTIATNVIKLVDIVEIPGHESPAALPRESATKTAAPARANTAPSQSPQPAISSRQEPTLTFWRLSGLRTDSFHAFQLVS